MTNRQVYQELARIAGYKCGDGVAFIGTDKCLKSNLRHVQSHLRALMEKLDYARSFADFRMARPRPRRHVVPQELVVAVPGPFDDFPVPPRMLTEQMFREGASRLLSSDYFSTILPPPSNEE